MTKKYSYGIFFSLPVKKLIIEQNKNKPSIFLMAMKAIWMYLS